jgi:hypothetical protein
MKIKMLESWPKQGGGEYEKGEVYEFPKEVAQRWIEQGIASKITSKGSSEGSKP